jgi:hypothetical protein
LHTAETKYDPETRSRARYLLAHVHAINCQIEEAEQTTRMIERDYGIDGPILRLIASLARGSRFEEAQQVCDRHPKLVTARKELALGYAKSGKFSEALDLLKTIENKNIQFEIWFELATGPASKEAGFDPGEALIQMQEILSAADEFSRLNLQAQLSIAYGKMGHIAKALQISQAVPIDAFIKIACEWLEDNLADQTSERKVKTSLPSPLSSMMRIAGWIREDWKKIAAELAS